MRASSPQSLGARGSLRWPLHFVLWAHLRDPLAHAPRQNAPLARFIAGTTTAPHSYSISEEGLSFGLRFGLSTLSTAGLGACPLDCALACRLCRLRGWGLVLWTALWLVDFVDCEVRGLVLWTALWLVDFVDCGGWGLVLRTARLGLFENKKRYDLISTICPDGGAGCFVHRCPNRKPVSFSVQAC